MRVSQRSDSSTCCAYSTRSISTCALRNSTAAVRPWRPLPPTRRGQMLRVWTDSQPAGHLDRHGQHGTTFVYEPKAAPQRAVSVTMPVRLASWDAAHGLLPIFDMNLP